ncbi:Bifunctional riboflavin kinase/FMN phosphatase [Sesamum alatum]|uniref:riboflavin kinase n=1 Tax=Sesamum alatum TaxID=300844 RepID=A0AAE1YZ11_9LAMI|nr:Bifunctional riboflavin kinase/FMN phosphatase [Sesamum alatum]
MDDWEDEPIPNLLKKKEQPKSNWDDEDLDDNDVKDSWEDEDEPAPAPKPEPPPPENVSKKAAGKSGEKKGKAVEAAKEAPLDPIEEKLRQQRPGVTAGKAAGMEVVAVPSIPKQSHIFTSADEVINSLLDLQPEKWGLPAFEDWIEGTLPIEPWYIGGPVIKGFGRGSKVLGIPTANLSTEGYSAILSEHPSGVYFGWAGLPTRGVYKMVMSIGWNPYFSNTEKTIEPWLLHDFNEDFYGEDLRLAIVGYIRPETNFPSLESLVAKIHEDRQIAERALELPQYSKYRHDPYLKSSPQ